MELDVGHEVLNHGIGFSRVGSGIGRCLCLEPCLELVKRRFGAEIEAEGVGTGVVGKVGKELFVGYDAGEEFLAGGNEVACWRIYDAGTGRPHVARRSGLRRKDVLYVQGGSRVEVEHGLAEQAPAPCFFRGLYRISATVDDMRRNIINGQSDSVVRDFCRAVGREGCKQWFNDGLFQQSNRVKRPGGRRLIDRGQNRGFLIGYIHGLSSFLKRLPPPLGYKDGGRWLVSPKDPRKWRIPRQGSGPPYCSCW